MSPKKGKSKSNEIDPDAPKKKKLTKAEKEKLQLQKDADTLRRSGDRFLDFSRKADKWLVKNFNEVTRLLQILDTENEGIVSFDEFKSVLFDLHVPLTRVEIHLLCQLIAINSDSEEIEYKDVKTGFYNMKDGLRFLRMQEFANASKAYGTDLTLTPRMSQMLHCQNCSLAMWQGEAFVPEYSKFFEISFRLAPFDSFKSHKCHFQLVLPCTYLLATIQQAILEYTQLPAQSLQIYRDKPQRDPKSLVHMDKTLEDYNYFPGPIDAPGKVTLYYDFEVILSDCPILRCDHYYISGGVRRRSQKIVSKSVI